MTRNLANKTKSINQGLFPHWYKHIQSSVKWNDGKTPVSETLEWLISGDEAETDVDDVDNQSDNKNFLT